MVAAAAAAAGVGGGGGSLLPRLPPRRYGTRSTVLSIDGGGMCGIIPALILDCFETKLKVITCK